MKDYTLTDTQLKVFKDLGKSLLACKDANLLVWFYEDSLAAVNGDVVRGVFNQVPYFRTIEELRESSVTTIDALCIASPHDGTLYIERVKDTH